MRCGPASLPSAGVAPDRELPLAALPAGDGASIAMERWYSDAKDTWQSRWLADEGRWCRGMERRFRAGWTPGAHA